MKNKYSKLKLRAISLRKNGKSYGEISNELNIPKSTLSFWLKSIPLRSKDQDRLYTKQILNLNKGAQSQKEKRAEEVKNLLKEAEDEIGNSISNEAFKLMGAALYWGEGSKGKRAQITNSDPLLILFMVKWIEKFFSINPKGLVARLNIYQKQNEKDIIYFWSELLGIPKENFKKSFIKPAGSGYRKNNLYHGTIRIEIPKSTDICYRINGWVNGALKTIENKKIKNKTWQHNLKPNKPVNFNKRP
jgi:hypothetical protein